MLILSFLFTAFRVIAFGEFLATKEEDGDIGEDCHEEDKKNASVVKEERGPSPSRFPEDERWDVLIPTLDAQTWCDLEGCESLEDNNLAQEEAREEERRQEMMMRTFHSNGALRERLDTMLTSLRRESRNAEIVKNCLLSSGIEIRGDTMYVGDELRDNVKSYDLAGSLGDIVVDVPDPKSVTCASGGDCYISDNNSIHFVKYASKTLTPTNIAVERPAGMYLYNDEFLFITDIIKHQIIRVDLLKDNDAGTVVFGRIDEQDGASGIKGPDLDQLDQPHGVWAVGSDKFYIADTNNHRILYHEIGNSHATVVAGITKHHGNVFTMHKLRDPKGISMLGEETMLIADTGDNRILKWTLGADFGELLIGGVPGGDLDQVYGPECAVPHGASKVYICDTKNHRILSIDLYALPSTLLPTTTTTKKPPSSAFRLRAFQWLFLFFL